MLLDAQNLFCENQSIASGTLYSTNTVKFGKGEANYVPLIIQVVQDFKVATKLTVKIQTSETEEFETPKDLVETTLLLEELTAGAKFPVDYLPKGNKGYMRLAFVVPEGETETEGKVTAGVVAAL